MDYTEGSNRTDRVLRQTRAVSEDVRELAGEIAGAAREISGRLDLARSVREHPFRSVLVAAGVGYVLGGGLFTPLTGSILRVGTRAMLIPLLKGQLEGIAAGAAGVTDR